MPACAGRVRPDRGNGRTHRARRPAQGSGGRTSRRGPAGRLAGGLVPELTIAAVEVEAVRGPRAGSRTRCSGRSSRWTSTSLRARRPPRPRARSGGHRRDLVRQDHHPAGAAGPVRTGGPGGGLVADPDPGAVPGGQDALARRHAVGQDAAAGPALPPRPPQAGHQRGRQRAVGPARPGLRRAGLAVAGRLRPGQRAGLRQHPRRAARSRHGPDAGPGAGRGGVRGPEVVPGPRPGQRGRRAAGQHHPGRDGQGRGRPGRPGDVRRLHELGPAVRHRLVPGGGARQARLAGGTVRARPGGRLRRAPRQDRDTAGGRRAPVRPAWTCCRS